MWLFLHHYYYFLLLFTKTNSSTCMKSIYSQVKLELKMEVRYIKHFMADYDLLGCLESKND